LIDEPVESVRFRPVSFVKYWQEKSDWQEGDFAKNLKDGEWRQKCWPKAKQLPK